MFVQQVRHPLQCHGSLTAAGRPLYDKHPACVIADNSVLFLLDSCHNTLHLRVCTFAEHLLQDFVSNRFTRVKHVADLPVLNLKLSFELHPPFDSSGRRDVRSQSGRVVVVQAGDWRTPVIDQKAHTVFSDEGRYADIDLLAEVQAILLKVESSKIR
ncbi:hypothetical protein D3C80_1313340 [compost metagenome]